MNLLKSWLHEWVNPAGTLQRLCSDLTMSGFEVESALPVSELDCASDVTKKCLNDTVLEIAVTPNRGDCLSVRGLAREIAAVTQTKLKPFKFTTIKPTIKDKLAVQLAAKKACPHYVGRVIREVNVAAATPDWMRERLLCCGIKSINVVVDVTNYVMLELGQPMHAFNYAAIDKKIVVRYADKGESITLLDGSSHELNSETLVIADQTKPIAIAGIMGGLLSAVTLDSNNLFLESAYFHPETIAKQRQVYGIHSESSYRFERSVDATIQREAIERATQLIIQYAGGKVGPVSEVVTQAQMPKASRIALTAAKLTSALGIKIAPSFVEKSLKSLGFQVKKQAAGWLVQPPAYRGDVSLVEDLIEEIARLYGYDKIPAHVMSADLQLAKEIKQAPDNTSIRLAMANQGYHEIVSYSFISAKLQSLFDANIKTRELINPMSAEMVSMRTNLWPGLVNAMLYNQNRQQSRIRLFEIGDCFEQTKSGIQQTAKLAGLIAGSDEPEQWGIKARAVDFFDIKNDVFNLLQQADKRGKWHFEAKQHPALHPKQTAAITSQGKHCGWIGALHPDVLNELGLANQKIFVFELNISCLQSAKICAYQELSKFPEIRRDIAILIKQTIPAAQIQDTIRTVAGTWLKDTFIFDVYQGSGVEPGLKSVAVALVLQHPTRTLVDDEVNSLMNQVVTALTKQLGAELRS